MRMTGKLLHGVDWALLAPRSREWNAAWDAMAKATGDADCVAEDEETGEVWQYMGTVRLKREWRHEFRHRAHPRARERVVIRVGATPGWEPRKDSLL
jgi:hypothetical protein